MRVFSATAVMNQASSDGRDRALAGAGSAN